MHDAVNKTMAREEQCRNNDSRPERAMYTPTPSTKSRNYLLVVSHLIFSLLIKSIRMSWLSLMRLGKNCSKYILQENCFYQSRCNSVTLNRNEIVTIDPNDPSKIEQYMKRNCAALIFAYLKKKLKILRRFIIYSILNYYFYA